MTSLFLYSYLLPASVVLLAFWAIWRIVRLFDLPVGTRRTLFVLLGTLGLSPMVVPAATILTAWVPHGLLITMPEIDYYVRLAHFVFPSFLITAVVFALISMRAIRAEEAPLRLRWHTVVVPILVAAFVFGIYRFFVPDRSVPRGLNADAIEATYGDELDAVASLLAMEDPALREREAERLQAFFDGDDAVVQVYLQTPSAMSEIGENAFGYTRGRSPPSKSCSGSYFLMRCTWSFDTFDRLETLRYRRVFEFAEERLALEIEFEYDKLRNELGD